MKTILHWKSVFGKYYQNRITPGKFILNCCLNNVCTLRHGSLSLLTIASFYLLAVASEGCRRSSTGVITDHSRFIHLVGFFFYRFIHLSVSFSNSQVDMGHLFQYAAPCQAPVTSKSDVGYPPLQAAPHNTMTSYDGLLLPETMQVDERNLSASAVPDKTTVTLL